MPAKGGKNRKKTTNGMPDDDFREAPVHNHNTRNVRRAQEAYDRPDEPQDRVNERQDKAEGDQDP